MEITILVESTDPLVGRVVTTTADTPNQVPTDAEFMGWLGLLRVLDELIGSSSGPPGSSPRKG